MSNCKSLEYIISRAREWEIELQIRLKHEPEQVPTVVGRVKRPKNEDLRLGGH